MTTRSFLIFIFYLFITSCGFKAVDQNYFKGFDIVPNIEGDDRIAYLLSNSLRKNSTLNTSKILINAKIKKDKNIKEKNIKNEITKYEVNISTLIKFEILNGNKTGTFRIEKKGFYDVNNKHSVSLNNEKKMIKNLVKQISEQLLNDLQLEINDS